MLQKEIWAGVADGRKIPEGLGSVGPGERSKPRRNPPMPADDRQAEMTRDGDNGDDAGDKIAASTIGQPESGRLDAFLHDLRSLAAGTPPVPSAELDAMLDGGADPVKPQRRPHRHRRTIAGAVIMGSLGAGLSGAAAAKDAPPEPARHVHAHFVPESAPEQAGPLGGPTHTRALRLPEPQPKPPKVDAAAPAMPQIIPTPPTTPSTPSTPNRTTPQSRVPAPSEDREPGSSDAEHDQDSEHENQEHDRGTEPHEQTPSGSDKPSD